MAACPSCGADNAPTATTCAYCDRGIVARKDLEIMWEVDAGEGVRGKGSLVVDGPIDTDVEQVRSLVQAAFSATLDELGTGASKGAVEGRLRERLGRMLAQDQRLTELRLHGIEVASSMVAVRRTCAFLAAGGVTLTCLVFAWAASATSGAAALDDLRAARVVTVEAARSTKGELIALEAVIADVDTRLAVSVPGSSEPLVAMANSEYAPDYASQFSVAGLPAIPDEDAVLLSLTRGKKLPQLNDRGVVRPGDEVTVVGVLEGDVLRVRVMTVPVPAEALARDIESKGRMSLWMVIVFVLIGLAFPVVVWKSRTVRAALKI
jgi:hypothetical protein